CPFTLIGTLLKVTEESAIPQVPGAFAVTMVSLPEVICSPLYQMCCVVICSTESPLVTVFKVTSRADRLSSCSSDCSLCRLKQDVNVIRQTTNNKYFIKLIVHDKLN